MALATKKIRVYELARELGVENQVVLDLAEELKIGVKSHSSSIDDPSADRVRRLADSRELRGEPIVDEPKPAKGKPKAEKAEKAERSERPARGPLGGGAEPAKGKAEGRKAKKGGGGGAPGGGPAPARPAARPGRRRPAPCPSRGPGAPPPGPPCRAVDGWDPRPCATRPGPGR